MKSTKQQPKSDLDDLLEHLDLTVEAITSEAAEQPRLFQRAAEYRISKLRRLQQEEQTYDRVEAEERQNLRENLTNIGQKATDKAVEEQIILKPEVIAARKNVDEAKAGDEASKLLLEAFRMRRDSIQVIEHLAAAEIAISKVHSASTSALKKAKSRLQEKYQEEEL